MRHRIVLAVVAVRLGFHSVAVFGSSSPAPSKVADRKKIESTVIVPLVVAPATQLPGPTRSAWLDTPQRPAA